MTPAEIDALNERTWELHSNDAVHALELSELAVEEAQALDYPAGLAFALRNRGMCRYTQLDTVTAFTDLTEALRLFRELRNRSGEAEAVNTIGMIHFHLNDLEQAQQSFGEAHAIRSEIGDRRGEAASLNNLGLVCFDEGRYLDSHDHHTRSLKIHEEIGNQAGAAIALNNLGLVFAKLDDTQAAIQCHQRSLELKRAAGNLSGAGASLNNLGDLSRVMGDYSQAEEYSRQGLELARKTGHRNNEAQALINLGEARQAAGDLEGAMRWYGEGLDVLSGVGDGFTQAAALMAIGDNLRTRERPDLALPHLTRALHIAASLASNELTSLAHEKLAQIYEALGDLPCALTHLRAFHQASAALHAEEAENRRRLLQIRAEVEIARSDAEIHRLKTVELARTLKELQTADEQKASLIRELAEKSAELERLSLEDPLTGLSNRRRLDQLAALEYERARRFRHPFSVAMLDIDDFKQINDLHSHLVGDRVLQTVASILRDGCRAVDCVGRYGGEEFLILLVEADCAAATLLCERLRGAVASHPWHGLSPNLRVTISVGVAESDSADSLEQQLAVSDSRLYRAKLLGKNRVESCHRTDLELAAPGAAF